MDAIGEKIRELRTRRGLSVTGLAAELDVSRQTVINWEKGKSVPSPELMYSLCKFFNVGIEQLIGSPVPDAEMPAVCETDTRVSSDGACERVGDRLDELKAQIESINNHNADLARSRKIIVISVLTTLCAALLLLAAFALILIIPYIVNSGNKSFTSLITFNLSSPTDLFLILGMIFGVAVCGVVAGLIYAKRHPKI